MRHPYEDILQHPRHVSIKHPQMSMHDRAAQFSPFAALVGYDDAVEQAALKNEEIQAQDTLWETIDGTSSNGGI